MGMCPWTNKKIVKIHFQGNRNVHMENYKKWQKKIFLGDGNVPMEKNKVKVPRIRERPLRFQDKNDLPQNIKLNVSLPEFDTTPTKLVCTMH